MKDNLRPARLGDMVGQTNLVNKLQICIMSALKRQEPLDHMLLYGPPGLGKTSLCSLIASEMGTNFVCAAAPQFKDTKSLASVILNLKPGDIFFIDEIHRLNIALEETLYSCIEDFKFPLVVAGSVLPLDLPKFTLAAATTRPDLVSAPMRSRFQIKEELTFYSVEELFQVLTRTATILGIAVEEDGLKEIARRSRGTPRIANNLLKRVRDFGIAEKENPIKTETVNSALVMLKLDPLGLDDGDRRYLHTLAVQFKGGPVGVGTLAAALSEPEDVLLEMREPYMIKCGILEITPQGRKIRQVETPMKETK